MATNLLSRQRSAAMWPGRVSQPRAHKRVYEKAELRAASLSSQHHAAHSRVKSSCGVPGAPWAWANKAQGKQWTLQGLWQGKNDGCCWHDKRLEPERWTDRVTGVPSPTKVKSQSLKPDLKMWYSEGSRQWMLPLSARSLLTGQKKLLQHCQHP